MQVVSRKYGLFKVFVAHLNMKEYLFLSVHVHRYVLINHLCIHSVYTVYVGLTCTCTL